MNNKKYSDTKQAYDDNADLYFTNTNTDFVPPPLQEFVDSLSEGQKVVDLGCGPGHMSELFTDSKIAYLGIDFSSKTIELAKNAYPLAEFEVGDFLNLRFEEKSVDAYIAIASLYHLTKEDFTHVLKHIYSTLKNNGKFYFVMKKGSGEHHKKDNRYPTGQKFVSYYNEEELLEILNKTGFRNTKYLVVEKSTVRKDMHSKYENKSVIVVTTYK